MKSASVAVTLAYVTRRRRPGCMGPPYWVRPAQWNTSAFDVGSRRMFRGSANATHSGVRAPRGVGIAFSPKAHPAAGLLGHEKEVGHAVASRARCGGGRGRAGL